jgi:hypothetical protein
MNARTLLLLSVLAGPAGAAPPAKPPADEASAEERTQLEQRARLIATMQISEVLGLDDAATLKLRDTLTRWDTQKAPIRQEMFDLAQVLRRAGRGDTTAYGQVDPAIKRIQELRSQLQQIDQQLFQQLSAGLPPQKKAKLALVMAKLPQAMREMVKTGKAPPREASQ